MTGIMFLDFYKLIFNSDYIIVGNKLIFEPKNSSKLSAGEWFDIRNISDRLTTQVCFTWKESALYAWAKFTYSNDMLDGVGNEAKSRYDTLVDWNISGKRKGLLQRELPISPARTRSDGLNRDILSKWGYADWAKRCLLLEKNLSALPKLVILHQGGNGLGEVAWGYANGKGVSLNQAFNYPMWFDDKTNGGQWLGQEPIPPFNNIYAKEFNSLYDFHKIDNDLKYVKCFNFEFTFRYTCDEIVKFLDNDMQGLRMYVTIFKNGTLVQGKILSLTLNNKEHTITVKGEC